MIVKSIKKKICTFVCVFFTKETGNFMKLYSHQFGVWLSIDDIGQFCIAFDTYCNNRSLVQTCSVSVTECKSEPVLKKVTLGNERL
jgi:hypothetical protein